MLKVSIGNYYLREIAAQAPHEYEILRQAANTTHGKLPPIEEVSKGYFSFDGFINDVEQLPPMALKKAEFEVVQALKIVSAEGETMRGAKLAEAMITHQVHLPGNELLKIKQVQVEENCCTDELQRLLEDGYRIVAVIPRAGQRRPDYVLGKT